MSDRVKPRARKPRKRRTFRRNRRRKDFSKLYAHRPEHRRPTLTLPVQLLPPTPGVCRLCADVVQDGRTGRKRTWHDGRALPEGGNEPDCGAEFEAKVEAWRHEWRIQTRTNYAKKEVAKRDGAMCKTCGKKKGRGYIWLALDHVVPLADEGSQDISNLQLLCPDCHKAKTAVEATARAQQRRKAA